MISVHETKPPSPTIGSTVPSTREPSVVALEEGGGSSRRPACAFELPIHVTRTANKVRKTSFFTGRRGALLAFGSNDRTFEPALVFRPFECERSLVARSQKTQPTTFAAEVAVVPGAMPGPVNSNATR